jgi:hypothetical protein
MANEVDFNRLADKIFIAEGGNKTRFAYGCERITASGKRYPYPSAIARQKCLQSINRAYNGWRRGGCKGDFVDFLGKTYAQDPLWAKKVRKLYNSSNTLNALTCSRSHSTFSGCIQ